MAAWTPDTVAPASSVCPHRVRGNVRCFEPRHRPRAAQTAGIQGVFFLCALQGVCIHRGSQAQAFKERCAPLLWKCPRGHSQVPHCRVGFADEMPLASPMEPEIRSGRRAVALLEPTWANFHCREVAFFLGKAGVFLRRRVGEAPLGRTGALPGMQEPTGAEGRTHGP